MLNVFPAFLAAIVAIAQPQGGTPPPPSIITAAPPAATSLDTGRGLQMWTAGDVRCEGGAAPAVAVLRRPFNGLGRMGGASPAPVTLRFAIDRAGRPHSISRDTPVPAYLINDIAPALASSRFAPGTAVAGCTIRYTSHVVALSDAPFAELVSYSINPRDGALPSEGWMRIRGGATCFAEPRPQALLRAYPEFQKISATPGVRDWSMIRFDIDADGRPVRPKLATGTGSRELDTASVAAVAASRFTRGPRAGCLHPYWRAAATLPAPPIPDVAEAPSGPCAAGSGWASPPRLDYPPAYRSRAIEGWAILSYDVASWGAIGNVQVIDAQPSEDFGIAAKTMLERARRPAGAGASGCRTRVRYEMAAGDLAREAGAESP